MAVIMPLDDGEEIPAAGDSLLHGDDPAQASSSSTTDADISSAGDVPIILAFDDLLPDANGEIVVMGADLGTQLSIMTDQRICAEGSGRQPPDRRWARCRRAGLFRLRRWDAALLFPGNRSNDRADPRLIRPFRPFSPNGTLRLPAGK